MERQLGFPGRYGRLFGYISNVDIEVTWGHELMGMVRPVLGLRALLSVCGYVRSFSRYGAKRVSPSVGVAIRECMKCCWLRVQMQYDAKE